MGRTLWKHHSPNKFIKVSNTTPLSCQLYLTNIMRVFLVSLVLLGVIARSFGNEEDWIEDRLQRMDDNVKDDLGLERFALSRYKKQADVARMTRSLCKYCKYCKHCPKCKNPKYCPGNSLCNLPSLWKVLVVHILLILT